MSSLYIGTGELEQFLIMELKKKLNENPKFKITILLDKSRGLRKEKITQSSYTMLSPLFNHESGVNTDNLSVNFIQHPNVKWYHTYLPSALAEVAGVLHSKIYLFDDTVMVSGANLSANYFTNRLDRYWVFQKHEPFADYCEDYVNSLCDISYKVPLSGSYELEHKGVLPVEKSKYLESIHHKQKMFKYEHKVLIKEEEDLEISDYFSNLDKYNSYYINRLPEEKLIKLKITENKGIIEEIEASKKEEISEVKYLKEELNQQEAGDKGGKEPNEECKPNTGKDNDRDEEIAKDSNEIYIFPSFQFKPIKIKDDEELLYDLFKLNKENEKILLSTGYFNPPKEMINILKASALSVDALTSSPRANSFYNGGFIKRHIPFIYRYILNKFQKEESGRFTSFEYVKENWSFHSKGLWFYKKEQSNPYMTVVGSSNYSKIIYYIMYY